MADYHDLVRALTWLLVNKLQNKAEYTRGLLGNGQGKVQVPNRADYSYVRPDRFSTRVYEVFNKMVTAGYDGLPVIIGELPWQTDLTQVLDVDWEVYLGAGWGDGVPGGRRHGPTHEWRDGGPGVDAFNVYRRQMSELRTYPVGSGSSSVFVSPYNFTHFEDVKSWSGLPGLDLSGAIPGGTGTARFVLTYWDPCSGSSGFLGVTSGTLGVDASPEILNRPAAPAGTIPSAYVRLAGGQSSVTEFDIWDARPLWMPSLEFATGSCGIWDGIIPIGDPGGDFTGSTISHALQQLADSGGGSPSGPAGGDLTGSYPNPVVDGLLGRPLGLDPVDEYYMLMYTGSAWQPTPGPFKLVAPDGAPDPALYSDNSGNITGVEWIAADANGFVVENRASGTVSAGAIGYIGEDGYFFQTATAYNDVPWTVVLRGGGHQQDVYVARRGRVTVELNGNCSVGDYLYTSTTAGQAQPQSYTRPELFAVALTANAGGAGGTCEALLLCQTTPVALALDDNVSSIDAAVSDSDWNGTIDSLPGGAAVRYDTSSGDEDCLTPGASTNLAKMRLYNSTRSNYALIEDNDITGGAGYDGEITLTDSVPGTWQVGDSITIRSQTNTATVGTSYFMDFEFTSSDVPTLTRSMTFSLLFRDTGGAGERLIFHPWEANNNAKRSSYYTQVANVRFGASGNIAIIQNRFCLLWTSSGAATVNTATVKVIVANVATP